MNYIEIKNIDLPELEIYQSFRENAFRSDGSFIADSPKVVNLLLEQNIEIKSILATQSYYDQHNSLLQKKNIPLCYVATKEEMQRIVGHKLHHNVMMHGVRPLETPLNELHHHIIMLDEISSSDNIGAIARSAAALGVYSYLVPKQGPHPYARRALRVSMGYISKLKFHCYQDIRETIQTLKQMGYYILAAEVTDNATLLSKVIPPEKWVLIMGHEQLGISKEILILCDNIVTIEMEKDIKSFNVAIAASIIMYKLKNIL
jgi:tRNA G18 (ribose-2'-O)-methylase SpoU